MLKNGIKSWVRENWNYLIVTFVLERINVLFFSIFVLVCTAINNSIGNLCSRRELTVMPQFFFDLAASPEMTNTPLGAVGLSLKCNVVDEEMIIDHERFDRQINKCFTGTEVNIGDKIMHYASFRYSNWNETKNIVISV